MQRSPFGVVALVLASALFATPALAGDSAAISEGWRYRWGDPAPLADGRPGWLAPKFEDSLQPTAAGVEPAGRAGLDILWVALPIPAIPVNDPALHIGNAGAGAVEVWVGGNKVYASGEIRPGASERVAHQGSHLAPLPREALGGWALVRVQSSGPRLALTRGVELGEGRDLFASAVRRSLIPVGIGVLGVAIGLGAFLGWLRFRRQFALLGLAGFSGALGALNIFQADLLPLLLGQSRIFYVGMALSAFASTPALCLFVATGVARERRRWFDIALRIEVASSVVAAVLTLLGFGMNAVMVPWIPFGVGGSVLAAAVSIAEARRKNFEARAFTLGMSALVVTSILESASAFGVDLGSGALPFGLLALLGSLVVVVASRFAEMLRRTEQHAQALQSREDEVRRLGAELSRGAEKLSGAVTSLRETSSSLAEVLRRQNAALTETQATTAQISQTSELASEKARAVLGAAERAEQSGRTGGAALNETLSGLEAVRNEVTEMTGRFNAVGARTREIDGVVETVKDLADQSHLLALNARIEAARAGENGLGFTVVAREMAQLAAQSLDATLKIRTALRGVDEAVRSAVELSAGGSARVDGIVAQARSSAERLREVAALATGTGASAREIATAVSQQNAGVGQILEAIRVLADGVGTANQAMADSDRAAANVQQVASELLQATARTSTVTV